MGEANEASFTVTGLTPGTAHTFRLRAATDDEGPGSPSSETAGTPSAGICGRIEAVRDAIVAKIAGVSDWADVTAAHLSAISGALEVSGQSLTALNADDFACATRKRHPGVELTPRASI